MKTKGSIKGIRPPDKFDNSYFNIPWVANDIDQCTFICTGVRDLLPGARYPHLPVGALSLYNILLFLVSDFYNHFTKMVAVSTDIQHSYCDIFSHHTI